MNTDSIYLTVVATLITAAIVGSVAALFLYARLMPITWISAKTVQIFAMVLVLPFLRSKLATPLILLSIGLGGLSLL